MEMGISGDHRCQRTDRDILPDILQKEKVALNYMKIFYHLPGLFEFYELYKEFLVLYREHREYFYDWCEIGSIYGAPGDCIWGGGRVGFGNEVPEQVAELMRKYAIPARLTFSNSLLREEHLSDRKCNSLCALFEKGGPVRNGVIICSDLLLQYLQKNYIQLEHI